MAYKITNSDIAKLQATVWLKSSAAKQETAAPTFKAGSIVHTKSDHTKLEVLHTVGAYALLLNPVTETTSVECTTNLIKVENDTYHKGMAVCLRNKFNVKS